jgi:hypothetical protein
MTFHLVCLLWIFFRAADLKSSIAVLTSLARWQLPSLAFVSTALMFLVTVLLLDIAARENAESLPVRESWLPWQRGLLFASLIVGISFVGETSVRPFLYFQF